MSLVLESKVSSDFKPHVDGIHPAVCVDVIELGLEETDFQGQHRVANKVRISFETEQKNEDGKNCVISKKFTASLHRKATLADFIGKWRGRPVAPGEKLDLAKLMGACCTLVISHQQNQVGRTYAAIDAVSKPTKKLTASGGYDPVLARQRIAEWKAKEAGERGGNQPPVNSGQSARQEAGVRVQGSGPGHGDSNQSSVNGGQFEDKSKSGAANQAAAAPSGTGHQDYDPEVGF